MCFSPEASFTATAILSIVGYACLKICRNRSQFFLALIPLLFAAQQFSEGMLWLGLRNESSEMGILIAKNIFLSFSFLLWPIWIPLSFTIAENIKWRKNLIIFDLFLGIVLAGANFFYGINHDISVHIVNHSIQYLDLVGTGPSQSYLYPFIIFFPCFITSLKKVWIFGILLLLGYFIADYYYSFTFVSVWCFFAAVVSLSIYKILKDNQNTSFLHK